tara:strand:+ start:1751 stop:2527 length:777 start_codon:yes stop_codon:yes gene_type:complete
MIYERMAMVTTHHTFSHPVPSPPDAVMRNSSSRITLVAKAFPCSLLSTCRLIHNEAKAAFAPMMQDLRIEPMRIIVDSASFGLFFGYDSTFRAIMTHASLSQQVFRTIAEIHLIRYFARYYQDPTLRLDVLVSQLCVFAARCSWYLHHRRPTSSIVAITRHPACSLRPFVLGFDEAIQDNMLMTELPMPIGFMLREAITDQFDDPPTSGYPEGLLRTKFKDAMTQDARFEMKGLAYHVADVEDMEWSEIWEESEHDVS